MLLNRIEMETAIHLGSHRRITEVATSHVRTGLKTKGFIVKLLVNQCTMAQEVITLI